MSAHSRLGRLRAKGAATPLPRPVEVGDRRSSVCASREGLRHGDHLVPRAAGSASWPGEGGPEREFATPPYRSAPASVIGAWWRGYRTRRAYLDEGRESCDESEVRSDDESMSSAASEAPSDEVRAHGRFHEVEDGCEPFG